MMEPMYFWICTAILGIGTFAIRGSIIYFSSSITITDRVKQILSFIPAAILPALLTPLVFYHNGDVDLFGGKERSITLIFAVLICFKTKSIGITIFSGLLILYLVKNVF